MRGGATSAGSGARAQRAQHGAQRRCQISDDLSAENHTRLKGITTLSAADIQPQECRSLGSVLAALSVIL